MATNNARVWDADNQERPEGPIDFATFDRIARRNHEQLRGNPFYRPAVGIKWLLGRRLIAMPSERVIEISERLLELIAAHPWTAKARHESAELTSATDGAEVTP